jgi:hypothetical protein
VTPLNKVKKTGRRRRIPWAQLLKRTFKKDVPQYDKCGGRMKLVAVVFDPPTIATTLRAFGLPVPAPHIERKSADVNRKRWKIDEKYGHRPEQKWDSES